MWGLVIIGLLILLFFIVGQLGRKMNGSYYDKSTNEYLGNWKEPTSQELREIGIIMSKNNIHGCGEYYVQKYTLSTYVIACTSDGYTWNYYFYTPTSGKIIATTLDTFTPPR